MMSEELFALHLAIRPALELYTCTMDPEHRRILLNGARKLARELRKRQDNLWCGIDDFKHTEAETINLKRAERAKKRMEL